MEKLYKKILRKSGAYFKTDMLYIGNGGFWLSLGQVFSSASVFVLAIAFANLMPVEVFGTYKYILSIASVLAITTLGGIDTAFLRSISRGESPSVSQLIKTKVKWGYIGSILALLGALYYYLNDNTLLATSLAIVALFNSRVNAFTFFSSILNGKKDFKRLSSYNATINIAATIILIGALFLTNNLFIILIAYFGTWTLLRKIFLKKTLLLYPLNKEDGARETISYGKHLTLIKGIATIVGSASSILLFHFLGAKSLALFVFAVAPAEQLRVFLRIAEQLFLPKISKDTWQISFPLFIKKIAPFLLAIFMISLLYIVAAPYIFKVFFPQYTDAIAYSQVYSLTLTLTGVGIILTSILKGKKKTNEQYILNGLDIITMIFITVPFIYLWGIWGLIYSIFLKRILEISLVTFFIFK